MKNFLISNLVKILIGMMNAEVLKKFADMLLDFVEDFVLETGSKTDDAVILPLCAIIRNVFDIPDDD